MEKYCPACGYLMTEEKVRKGAIFIRSLVYDVCTNCNYRDLHIGEKERAIEDGVFDDQDLQ